ncbi:MAG: UDP-glucose 4-epimerase family protein [Polaromonas sp.]
MQPLISSGGPVLVTGAGGFVGQALVAHLAAAGIAVTGVSRSHARGAGSSVRLARYEDAVPLLAGRACVVHLAARVHVMRDAAHDPLAAFRAANTDLPVFLARQAAAAGVRRFVFVSSIKVNGEATAPGQPFTENDACAPLDPYGVSKWEAEQALREVASQTGMELVIIRPPLIYGPGVRANFAALLRAVAQGIPLPLGAIDNRRSLLALDNLLDFITLCLRHPGAANQTFLVSDAEDLSTPELIRRMARVMQKPVRLITLPVILLKAAALVLGRRNMLERLCGNLQLDISKARTRLGWNPPLTVEEGLRRILVDNKP